MAKEVKTNAMRILEQKKIPYTFHSYECETFVDGITVAQKLGQAPERTFKTLATQGKSRNYFVFVLPVAEELDLKKAARLAGEKSIEMVPLKDILQVTGYIRGGCTPVGMKKPFLTFFHETCLAFETIFVSGGKPGTQIEVSPQDLIAVSRGTTADIICQ